MSKILSPLLFCLILFLPSQLGLHTWPSWSLVSGIKIDYLSPTLYFTDLIVVALLSLWRKLPKPQLLLVAFAVFNIALSLSPHATLASWLRVLEYYWLGFFLISQPQNFLKALALGLPTSIIWTSVLAWSQFVNQSSLGGLWYWLGERQINLLTPTAAKIQLLDWGIFLRPYSTFSHPNSLAGFLLVAVLIVLYLSRPPFLACQNRIYQHLVRASLILGSATLILTFSKSAIITGGLLLLLSTCKTRTPTMIKISLCLLITIFFGLITFSAFSFASFAERLLLIEKSLHLIISRPLAGSGLGNFPLYQSIQLVSSNPHLNFQPVHNIYLLLLSETGTVGFLGLSIFFLNHLDLIQKILSKSPLLALAVTGVCVTGLFDHYWLTLRQNQLLLVMLTCLIVIQRHAKQ